MTRCILSSQLEQIIYLGYLNIYGQPKLNKSADDRIVIAVAQYPISPEECHPNNLNMGHFVFFSVVFVEPSKTLSPVLTGKIHTQQNIY